MKEFHLCHKKHLLNCIIVFSALFIVLSGCASQQQNRNTHPASGKNSDSSETPKSNTSYIIKKGDTLWSISKRYGVSVESLRKINKIDDFRDLKIGQKLIIPITNNTYKFHGHISTIGTSNGVSSKGFIWPLQGDIVSGFNETKKGEKFLGICIVPHAEQKIVAAKKGTVEAVSESQNNYYVIVIKHDWGVRTLYGCRCNPVVGEGNNVKQGQPIAVLSQSGTNKSGELSFKIYIKDKPVNPINYLP